MTSSGIRQLSEDRLVGSLAYSSSVLTDQPLSCPLPTHRPLPSSLKFRGSPLPSNKIVTGLQALQNLGTYMS